MTVSSATAPGSEHAVALAHGIHYGIVAAGVVGTVALLAPQFLERLSGSRSSSEVPRDEHEARVRQLRARAAAGSLATLDSPRSQTLTLHEPLTTYADRVLLPMAFVSSAAAAGVHAAMGPAHFREQTLFGLFFAVSSTLQLLWAAALLRRPSRRVLALGAVGNAGVIALWATTRSVGIPALMPVPEPVGAWDLASVGWELVIVAACLWMLARPDDTRPMVAPDRWDPVAGLFAIGSVGALVALTVGGAGG